MTKSSAIVIFNFIDFDVHDGLQTRTSSLRDVERLEKLFHLFDTSIQKIINPNLQKFKEEIEKLEKNQNFDEYDSILLIYMSHGDTENEIYCSDGQFNFLEESKKIFRNSTLNGKPKFIIVQACKGSFDKDFYEFDSKEDGADDSQITAILTSSFEGFVSRLGVDGSQFIKTFTETLRKSWNKKPFVQILTDVSNQFNMSQYESAGTIHIRPNIALTIQATASTNMLLQPAVPSQPPPVTDVPSQPPPSCLKPSSTCVRHMLRCFPLLRFGVF